MNEKFWNELWEMWKEAEEDFMRSTSDPEEILSVLLDNIRHLLRQGSKEQNRK